MRKLKEVEDNLSTKEYYQNSFVHSITFIVFWVISIYSAFLFAGLLGFDREDDSTVKQLLGIPTLVSGIITFIYYNNRRIKINELKEEKKILEKELKKKEKEKQEKRKKQKEENKRKREEAKRKKEEEKEEKREKLIEKYGEKDGIRIFKRRITESDYIEQKKLIDKFGSRFGKSIFKKRPMIGMSRKMIQEIDKRSVNEPKYIEKNKDLEKWFYASHDKYTQRQLLGFGLTIVFKNGKISDIQGNEKIEYNFATSTNEDGLWLDMPQAVLLKACGKPKDKKKSIGRDLIKEKWYYGDRETRQGTTAYKWEVRLENGIVSGWAELE